MKPHAHRRMAGAVALALASLAPLNAGAATTQPPVGKAATSVGVPRFDEARVRGLIDKAEVPVSGASLRWGYFASRAQCEFPRAAAFGLLQQACAREPAHTPRWFALRSVQCFAGFFAFPDDAEGTIGSYSALFEDAALAERAGCAATLDEAVYEFTALLPKRNVAGGGSLPYLGASDALAKALSAHLAMVADGYVAKQEPLWATAIRAAGNPQTYVPIAEAAFQRSTAPRNFALCRTLVAVYSAAQPDRALPFWQRPEVLQTARQPAEIASYYGGLARLLWLANRVPEAVAAQRILVQRTGAGQALLLDLEALAGDERSFEGTAAALDPGRLPEDEVLGCAGVLKGHVPIAPVAPWCAQHSATLLLQGYLNRPGIRGPEHEARARLMLAQLLLSQKRNHEALDAVSSGAGLDRLPPDFGRWYDGQAAELRRRAEVNDSHKEGGAR